MSFKRFDLDKDTFYNHYFQYENIGLFYLWFSGTAANGNVKFPNHYVTGGISGSYFVEFYDRPRNDVSSVKVSTMTYGYTPTSTYHSGNFVPQYTQQKLKMYRLMAKHLLGDENKKFQINGTELNEALFLAIPRNQYRDNIVPRSSELLYYWKDSPGNLTYEDDQLTDRSSKIYQEFGGEYTTLKDARSGIDRALLFSKAGIYIIDPNIFNDTALLSSTHTYEVLAKGVSGTTYNDLLWALKYRFYFVSFTGSSKVESAYYKCTIQPSEFNYSSNPSFVNEHQQIRSMISGSRPTTYVTQIGLLGQNNELLAVAKLQKPLRNDPTIGAIIHVRVDQ